jgi:hypothetical protein
MRVERCCQAAFDHGLGQLLEQAVLGQHILGIGIVLSQFIHQFASTSHGFLLQDYQFFGFCHIHKLVQDH